MTTSVFPLYIQMLLALGNRRRGIHTLLTGALVAVIVGLSWVVVGVVIGLRVFDGPPPGVVSNIVTFTEAMARMAVLVLAANAIWHDLRRRQ